MNPIKDIHIGSEIEAVLNFKDISKSEFARMANTSKQNISRILSRSSMETESLKKYSELLDFNFFSLFCQEEQPKVVVAHPDVTDHSAFSATGDVLVDDHRGGLDFSTKTKGDESELVQSLRDQIAILKNNLADKERIIKIYEGKD